MARRSSRLGNAYRYALAVCPWIFGRTGISPGDDIGIDDVFISGQMISEADLTEYAGINSRRGMLSEEPFRKMDY
jgi:hypothetical protein